MSTGKAEARRAEQRAAEDRKLTLSAIQDAKKPSYFEERAENQVRSFDEWESKKDYRGGSPGMISLGYADTAQRQRMRERTMGMADTGAAALAGGGNATALGLAKMNAADELDRDQAGAYEGAIRDEQAYHRGGGATWAGLRSSRDLGIVNAYSGMNNTSAQLSAAIRPTSLLPGLISGGLAGLGAAMGNPAGLSNLWVGQRK